MTAAPKSAEQWRVNPETPTVILTPHGRISVSWSMQREGEANDFTLAEETAALIVDSVNQALATQTPSAVEVIGWLETEQKRLDDESGDYLMDTRDCINVIRERLFALSAGAEDGRITGEVLFRAFMAGDVPRLTTTALPDEWAAMKPSYRGAWDDLAAAIRVLSGGGK